uniref:acid phosphatase n=1 Tax=Rhizophora mucronata TaxID=61149 RepID=A0A2P2JPZ7_RHIMU
MIRLPVPCSNLQSCHSFPKLLSQETRHLPKYTLSRSRSQDFHLQKKPTKIVTFLFAPRSVVIKASSMASSPTPISSSSTDTKKTNKPFSVLFVCLGNICRSPAAEGVFRNVVKNRDLDSKFNIDSAGTINYHEGNPADPRMRAASKKRGIEITSISRPIRSSDFMDFDLILAMDKQNRVDILEAYNKWKFREPLPDDAHKKVRLMCSYCKKHDETEVPDPYYGGPQGFEKVLDLLEDACESLLDSILAENSDI